MVLLAAMKTGEIQEPPMCRTKARVVDECGHTQPYPMHLALWPPSYMASCVNRAPGAVAQMQPWLSL